MADPAPAPSPAPAGDPTPTPPQSTPPADPPAPEPPGDEPLGEAGKRALDAERRRAAELDKQLKAATAELDEFKRSQMSETEKAIEAARREGETAAEARWRQQTARLAVEAAAAGRFADPDDAARFIGDDIPFTETGEVDKAAIAQRLDELLTAKPYLGVASGTPAPAPPPAVPTGPRGGPQASQLTRADLKRMTSAEIVAARREGRLQALMESGA